MRKFLRYSFRALILLGLANAMLFGWLSFTTVSADELPPLKNGDIIFQTSGSNQSLAILAASRSAYTHVGIIEIASNGNPVVVEAVGPVKLTPIDEWIVRGKGKRVTIKRVKKLAEVDAQKALAAAHVYIGAPYDVFFTSGKDAIYCSELVYLAFLEGLGLKLGKIEKVKELKIDNVASRNLIERRWRRHPLCQTPTNETFESCYAKILEQELVTPVSIAVDLQLETIFTNYGLIAQ